MRLTIKTRVDALSKHFNRDPAFILVEDDSGTLFEISVDEYLKRAYAGDFSLSFKRMTRGGNVADAYRVLDVFELAQIKRFGNPSALCSDRVRKWWETNADK